MKEKKRVIRKTYFNENPIFLLQVYERNCFKSWVNIGVTTNQEYAEAWGNR